MKAHGQPSIPPVRSTPLAQIDASDTSCQYRFTGWKHEELVTSLQAKGQQEPIHLRGADPPYKIVDGFRRHAAALALGLPALDAFHHGDISEREARSLAFSLNATRKNLTPLEKMNAVLMAEKEFGLDRQEQARLFGVSERTLRRYHLLGALPENLRAVVDGRIVTLAHALVLRDHRVKNPKKWARRVEQEHLSSKQLERAIVTDRGEPQVGRRRKLFTRRRNKLYVHGTLDLDAPRPEKEAFIDELLRLQDIVRESMGEDELDLDLLDEE